jgi:hypothetical protein
MQQPKKAKLKVEWGPGNTENLEVAYNPTELSFSKSAQIAEIDIPGLDAPLSAARPKPSRSTFSSTAPRTVWEPRSPA